MSPSHNSNSMDGFNTMTFRASAMNTSQQGGPGMQQQLSQQQQQQQPMQQQILVSSNASSGMTFGGASMAPGSQQMGVALDPLFVAPPPKTHKALHSDVSCETCDGLLVLVSILSSLFSGHILLLVASALIKSA